MQVNQPHGVAVCGELYGVLALGLAKEAKFRGQPEDALLAITKLLNGELTAIGQFKQPLFRRRGA